MSDQSFGHHISKRHMMTIVYSIIIVNILMLVWNSHSVSTFSGSQADLDRTKHLSKVTLNLEGVVAELGAVGTGIMQHDKQHFDNLSKTTLILERAVAELSDTLLANQILLNQSLHHLKLCNQAKVPSIHSTPPPSIPAHSLAPAIQAAASEVSGQSSDLFNILTRASHIDKRLTPPESRGRELTQGSFWVILACNDDPMYAFSIPIVALAWSKVVRARPLVLLIGSEFRLDASRSSRNSWIPLFLQTLQEFSIESVVLDSGNFSSQHYAQISRLFAFKLQRFKASDYVLFGDGDLMPLHASTYQTDRNWQRKLHIINAFCCEIFDGKNTANPVVHSESSVIIHLAMCHAGASVSTWNEIFSFVAGGQWDAKDFEQYMKSMFEKGGIHWTTDQIILSTAVHEWKSFPDAVELVARSTGSDRIDRSNWNVPGSIEGFVDSHMLRPLHNNENWPRAIPLFKLVFGASDLALLEKYRQKFVQLSP